jgi:apolipoprotein N-acyltransferase
MSSPDSPSTPKKGRTLTFADRATSSRGTKYKVNFDNYKQLFIHGTISGSFVTIISYFWMNYLFVVFGGFPVPIAFILFLLYSFITNLRFGVFLVLFSFLKKFSKVYAPILAAFGIIFSEFFTFQIFPYFIGNLIAGDLDLSQTIDVKGESFRGQ